MEKFIFQVQGSTSEPYTVTFIKKGKNLSAYCTCPAGINGLYCKHRFAIMDGELTALVSKNIADANKIAGWLKGTDVEKALQELASAEKELVKAQNNLSLAKKKLAASMID